MHWHDKEYNSFVLIEKKEMLYLIPGQSLTQIPTHNQIERKAVVNPAAI